MEYSDGLPERFFEHLGSEQVALDSAQDSPIGRLHGRVEPVGTDGLASLAMVGAHVGWLAPPPLARLAVTMLPPQTHAANPVNRYLDSVPPGGRPRSRPEARKFRLGHRRHRTRPLRIFVVRVSLATAAN